jgi:hypothetical protein
VFISYLYKEIKEDLTTKIENKIKKKVEGMYKRNVITKEMKGYLIPKRTHNRISR